ncbi:SIT4 phosphatase-associated protein-domain-containing protein [Sporodiniella umbellata]|nr:SIT4 phosphatase-associated protein-domain-containing protein [Sporodiniella umbellata]
MFWRFGFSNSALDGLLDKADVSLEEVLEEEDLLQEAKSANPKLIDFLKKTERIKTLLDYITATDLQEPKRFKYPFLASEIIACEIQPIIDQIVVDEREVLLVPFWSYLDQSGTLDSLQASYFCKTVGVLLSKYPAEMLHFIQSKPENLKKILRHLQTSAMMDLLLTLVRMEELREGKGMVKWLSQHGLLESLMDRLDPYLGSEEHSIAQQCICEIIRMSQTSLPESPSIGLNDLILTLKSEAMMQRLTGYMLDSKAPHAISTLVNGVSILVDMIRHNNADLENDPAVTGIYGYTGSSIKQAPVSLAEMLNVMSDRIPDFTYLLSHPRQKNGSIKTTLGNMEALGFERLKICELFAEILHCSNMSNLNPVGEEETAGDYLKSKIVQSHTLPICIDLFFAFPWNNFLHYVIYDMLHQVFNGRMDLGLNRQLALAILQEARFTDKIIQAQKANDQACAEPKGMRAGYMGHLTFISDEIVKLFEGYPETIVLAIQDHVDLEAWQTYCDHELKQTKERDQLPLGGLRPSEDLDLPATDEEENDPVLDLAAAQYSRFLEQRESEEEEEEWLNQEGDQPSYVETRTANDLETLTVHSFDQETPTDWTDDPQQPNALRRVPSHTVAVDKEEDEFGDFESANGEGSFDTIKEGLEKLDVKEKVTQAVS